jgi:hypothetical protein
VLPSAPDLRKLGILRLGCLILAHGKAAASFIPGRLSALNYGRVNLLEKMGLAISRSTCLLLFVALPRCAAPPASASHVEKSLPLAVTSDLNRKDSGRIDTAAVRKLYLESDFEEAITMLLYALAEKKVRTHADSIFVFKHLGVMYASKYDTREKGKYFMHQLLTVEPTARILDMYASDMIYMIFKNVQEEYDATHLRFVDGGQYNPNGGEPVPIAMPRPQPSPPKSHRAYYWIGAVGFGLAVGAASYFALANQSVKTVDKDHSVPE